MPGDPVPGDPVPGDPVPGDPVPGDPVPGGPYAAPADLVPLASELGALRVGPHLLAEGHPGGPLHGVPLVVKDLIDVAGVATGAGNPDFLRQAEPASDHAPAVTQLLAAGADVIGKSITDELAFSLSGTNVHYGTPRNPRDAARVPGGSSSGSVSAVAGGLVPLALATDTGGSIRVPASYCGVFGLRPTHGRVPLAGVVELAPSFDTVGILAVTGAMLAAGGMALLAAPPETVGSKTSGATLSELVVADDLLEEADPAAGHAVSDAAHKLAADLGIPVHHARFAPGWLDEWLMAFRGRQMVEAWAGHGAWIERHHPAMGPGIAGRFDQARQTPVEAGSGAAGAGAQVRRRLDAFLPPGAAMVLPSAATVAPPIELTGPAKDDLRLRTMRLTCVAGLGGLPALSLPLAAVDGLPVGVGLVGRPGDDERLLATVAGVEHRPW